MTAATLVREEIRARDYNKEECPVTFEMKNTEAVRSFLTPWLQAFLDTLISNDRKRVGIGHAWESP